jgi:hypothetical protein
MTKRPQMTRQDEYSRLCATKAGRAALLVRTEKLASDHGATIERHEFEDPREIGLYLDLGPYRCMIHFEGGSFVGAFLGHWCTQLASNAKYPKSFWAIGSLNEYHYGKATTCEDTADAFFAKLAQGLELLKPLVTG